MVSLQFPMELPLHNLCRHKPLNCSWSPNLHKSKYWNCIPHISITETTCIVLLTKLRPYLPLFGSRSYDFVPETFLHPYERSSYGWQRSNNTCDPLLNTFPPTVLKKNAYTLLKVVFSHPTGFNTWGMQARGTWLKFLFNTRRIGISFFTVSGSFRKYQAWPSINWMIGTISTRSKRPECDADTTVPSQELSIHDFSTRKICRLFSSVHEISPCKWAGHVSYVYGRGWKRNNVFTAR